MLLIVSYFTSGNLVGLPHNIQWSKLEKYYAEILFVFQIIRNTFRYYGTCDENLDAIIWV